MKIKYNATITALGGYVPETVLDNIAIEKMVDTSADWIFSRTGIKERHILEKDLATSDMAAAAIKKLIADSGVNPLEIECLLLATSTPDHLLVSTASIVCDKAGLTNAWGMDVNSACSGFLYALTLGASLIESGRYKNVLLVGADKMSAIVNYEDRNTCILFGDGAGAVLLEQTTENAGLMDNVFKTDGKGKDFLTVRGGGSKIPATHDSVDQKLNYITQDGKVVFKAAIKGMSETCSQIIERNDLSIAKIDWVVPHQANLRIIQSVCDMLKYPIEKVKINIEKYGNTTSATIPLCLWDFGKDFKEGDNLLITAFGAGFSWGASYLKWGKLRMV